MANRRSHKGRVCLRCGQEYTPTGSSQKYCFECGRINAIEIDKLSLAKRKKEHPERYDRAYKRKTCLKCGREYQSTGRNQKFCVECTPIPAERIKEWRVENPERARASSDAWELLHPEKMREYQKEYTRLYAPLHRHEAVLGARRWQKKNPEKVREMNKKHTAKRRALGFIPINSPFEGSDAHHFEKEQVIYIPHALHQSVFHNIWTGKNMEQINKLAFAYLGGN